MKLERRIFGETTECFSLFLCIMEMCVHVCLSGHFTTSFFNLVETLLFAKQMTVQVCAVL